MKGLRNSGATLALAVFTLASLGLVASPAQAEEARAKVEVRQLCYGKVSLDVKGINLAPELGPVSFAFLNNLTGEPMIANLENIEDYASSNQLIEEDAPYDFTATGTGGYEERFTGVFDCYEDEVEQPTPVTPAAPSFNDELGTTSDTYTVPGTEGVDYLVSGEVAPAGTYPGAGTVTITARPQKGYVIEGNSEWTYTFTNEQPPVEQPTPVTPTAPTFYDNPGTDKDTYTVPSSDCVKYVVDGEVVEPGKPHPATGSVTITAVAKDGCKIEGNSEWTYTFTNEQPPVEQPEPPVVPEEDNAPPVVGNGDSSPGQRPEVTPPANSGLNAGFDANTGVEAAANTQGSSALWGVFGLTTGSLVLLAGAWLYRRKTGAQRA